MNYTFLNVEIALIDNKPELKSNAWNFRVSYRPFKLNQSNQALFACPQTWILLKTWFLRYWFFSTLLTVCAVKGKDVKLLLTLTLPFFLGLHSCLRFYLFRVKMFMFSIILFISRMLRFYAVLRMHLCSYTNAYSCKFLYVHKFHYTSYIIIV